MEGKGYRKTGRCYRRCMRIHQDRRLRKIIEYGGYNPYRGYVIHDFVDGQFVPVGKYIKYPRNSKAPQYLKRQTWHRVRRCESLPPKGNHYRKIFDFWWELF